MKGFMERLQWRLAGWMQGRHGMDSLSNGLLLVGIVLTVLSWVPGLDLLSWVALVFLVLSLFRCFSKNDAKRIRENETFQRVIEKPKKSLALSKKAWTNRKTTRYFRCKGCDTVLSVPRGKGTLRVVLPEMQDRDHA